MAPRYREASASQKGVLLDEITATTGYARRYAMWLLNHPQEGNTLLRIGGNVGMDKKPNMPCS
jgi:hypothetical protein